MSALPNLAGVATDDLIEQIGGSGFAAKYINWSRTMNLLRKHAPDWQPELVPSADGLLHRAPVGAYLLIRFRRVDGGDGQWTPAVPQAVMDNKNAAIAFDKITARDITDTHVRGVCKAAAFTFGLAYELWAKLPLESGFAADVEIATRKTSPTAGAWEGQSEESQAFLQKIADVVSALIAEGDVAAAVDHLEAQQLDADERVAIWTRFDSKQRSAMKKTINERRAAA